MAHWGYFWKVKQQHKARTLCSDLTTIDSFKLVKNGIFQSFSVQPLDIKAIVHSSSLHITYRNQKNNPYTIQLHQQPCTFGGVRYFFACPLCNKRMRILYLASKSVFLCRSCLNLSYKSSQLRPTKRYEQQAQKQLKQLMTKAGSLEQKPKGMHTKTYEKIKALHQYYRCKSNQAMNQELRAWYGSTIEPYLDQFFDYAPPKPS